MKKKLTIFGFLLIVFTLSRSSAQTLSLTSSNSYQTAINLTYSNPSMVGNRLTVNIQITNTSGTWVYLEEDLTSSPTGIPYTDYLLGPNGTLTFQNVSFGTGNFLQFNVTTPIGLNYTDLDPKCRALFGALTVDYMMRGFFTTPLPADAFDNMTGAIDPVLDGVVSSLGSVGELAGGIKDRNYLEISSALADLVQKSDAAKSALSQIFQKYVTSGQVDNFFDSASDTLGFLTQVLDVSEKIQLLNSITQSTFNAPLQTVNRLNLVATVQAPAISYVSPSTLTGLPIGQTQLIRVIGSGFTGSPTLTFNDGVDSPFTGRVPTVVSANELDYNISVGTNRANWTVQVVNGSQTSNLGYFAVNAPPATPSGSLVVNLSPAGAVSAGAQWQVDGGTYYSSGGVVPVLTPGSHTVSFKSVSGYTTPSSQTVTINANAQTTASGTYTVNAPSTYTLTLNQGGSAGYIVNQPFGSGSGNIYTAGALVQVTANANFGYHFVNWSGDVSGTANPTMFTMNGNKSVTANFAAGDPNLGTIVVTIQPPEAVAAGVTWGFNDNDFRASGSSYSYYPETVWVELHNTNGWVGVGGWVTYTAGQTSNYTFTASSTSGSIIGNDPRTYYTLAGSAGNYGSSNGTNADARFNGPWFLAIDKADNIFVSDANNNIIRKVSPLGVVTTIAGQAGVSGSSDGQGTNALFNHPLGITIDQSNNLYVADFFNSTIRKITPDGTVSTFAGTAGNNGSNDGNGNAASFYFPIGVAVDTNGNVFVADSVNETIRKITPNRDVSTLAGLARNYGSVDATGSNARFHNPEGLAVDFSGNIYVADEVNATVRKITPEGAVTTLAGFPGSAGTADGTGNAARFQYLNDVAVDASGNVYVADTGNNAIRKITPSGVVTTLAGQSGNPGSMDGIGSVVRFNNPGGVAVDTTGNLFISDIGNYTIRATQPLTTRVDQTIAFAPLPNKSAGDVPFALTATASSGLPVYFAILSGPALMSSNVVTLVGSGTVTLIAWQPGDTNYNAAVPVQQSFNVSQIPQTITFDTLSQQKQGDAPFPLNATADSGLPVSFSIVSGPATLSGNILVLNGWGTVTVSASQTGNNSYAAATSVTQSFLAAPPDNTIVSPQRLSNGNFQLAFYGLMNTNYTVQASTNLINWQTFTNFTGSNSVFYLNDSSATNFKQRFYRVTP